LSKSPVEPAFVSSIGSNLQVPWRDIAPKRSDIKSVIVGPFAPAAAMQLSEFLPNGIEFEGFKADGSRAWRVAIQPESIVVNCLVYPGWNTAWPMIRSWFEWILTQHSTGGFAATSFVLQYVNAFLWEGDVQGCRPSAFLQPNSLQVAPALYDYDGGRWHQHSGRYDLSCAPFDGETLVRTQLGGNRLPEPTGFRYEATADIYLQAFLRTPADIAGELGEGGRVSQLYENMHALVKRELSAYLSDGLAQAIRLNG